MKTNNTTNHPSYHRMLKMSPEAAILTSICKSFIIEDEEFYKHPKTKNNKHNPDFWIEIGNRVTMLLHGHLTTMSMQKKMDSITVMDYIMCQRYRNDLVDFIIPVIEQYLNDEEENEGYDD